MGEEAGVGAPWGRRRRRRRTIPPCERVGSDEGYQSLAVASMRRRRPGKRGDSRRPTHPPPGCRGVRSRRRRSVSRCARAQKRGSTAGGESPDGGVRKTRHALATSAVCPDPTAATGQRDTSRTEGSSGAVRSATSGADSHRTAESEKEAHAASVACQPSCTFAAAPHAVLHHRNKLFSSLLLQADGEAEEEQRRKGERVSSISRLLSLVRSSASPVRSWAAADRAEGRGASAFCSVTNLSCDDAVFADSSCNRCCFRFETRGMFCFLGFVGY
jgi:hypothetical protein